MKPSMSQKALAADASVAPTQLHRSFFRRPCGPFACSTLPIDFSRKLPA